MVINLAVTTSLIFFSMLASASNKITLSQKDVAEMVLKQSTKTEEANLKYQLGRFAAVQARSVFDWRLTAETGTESDKTESFSIQNAKYNRLKTTVGLTRQFSTGTILGLDYSRISQKLETNSLSTGSSSTSLTSDNIGLSIEQALLYDAFGEMDRANVEAADKSYLSSNIVRANELQEIVLESIRLFWNAYVSQENFKEALASRDRYQRLVESVNRKTNYGYANPGELAQVQAELETRKQSVKATSQEYLRNLETMVTLLNLPVGSELEFNVKKELPPIPALEPVQLENLRSIKSQQLKLEATELSLVAAKSKSKPALNLVGKLGSSGLESSAEESYAEMTGGTKSKYYIGLKFVSTFGNDSLDEEVLNKKLSRDLEVAKLKRQKLESFDRLEQSQRKVRNAYDIADSAVRVTQLREKAMQQLNTAFNQGRTDISVLIDAINRYYNSQILYIRAVGDYQIALNEWAASRDELIPSEKE